MENESSKLEQALILLLLLPVILLMCIWAIIFTPFDIIKYHSSKFYRDTRIKYHWLASIYPHIRLYNLIKKENLPIAHYRFEGEYGWRSYFKYRDILIIYDYDVRYDEEIGGWAVSEEGDHGSVLHSSVEEAVGREIQDFNNLMQAEPAQKAVILAHDDKLFKDGVPTFENCEILLTRGNTAAALRAFIEKLNQAEMG